MKKIILALGLIVTLLLFLGAKSNHKDEVNSATMIEYSTEYEAPLEIEDWMMKNDNFEVFNMEEETEEPLNVEDWMLSERYWN